MPREFHRIFPVDGGLDGIAPTGSRQYETLQNVYCKSGHLRRRPALVTTGPTSTPGTAGNVRLLVEHQHGDSPPLQYVYPTSDDIAGLTRSAGANNYALVDEVTADGDTTYVYDSGVVITAGTVYSDYDFYGFTTVAGFSSIDQVEFICNAYGTKTYSVPADEDVLDKVYVTLYISPDAGVTKYSLYTMTLATYYSTQSIVRTTDPITGTDWTQTALNTYSMGWRFSGFVRNWAPGDGTVTFNWRGTSLKALVSGSAAATRERSKIVISNTEFLRLEEDLSTFTDIDDTLASTAAATEPWDTCEFDNLIWFTNNTDDFFKYPDAGNLIDQNTTNLEAKTISPYGLRLFAMNVEEGGSRYRSRVRWSIIGDGDDFAGAGSGNFDMDAVPGEGIKLLPMAEKANTYVGVLVAYKDSSIYHIYATGDSSDPFDYRLMDGSVGAVGVNAVTKYVNDQATEVHAFVGKRNGELNVFEWNGNQTVPIGDRIKDALNAGYNPASVGSTVVNFDPNTSLMWVGVPQGAESFPATFYTYDIIRKTWKTMVFNKTVAALGQFLVSSDSTLVAGKTDGLVLKSDKSTTVDTGGDVATIITIGDMFMGGFFNTFTIHRVWLSYVWHENATLTVDASADGGNTWCTASSVSLTGTSDGDFGVGYGDINNHGRGQRVRIQCATDADVEIREIGIEWEIGGRN